MKINKIILSGYKPLMVLSNIKTIEIDIENNMSLILGTNGSGKSSLLKELNHLPPTASEFEEGGFKHVYSEHNGSTYEQLSVIKGPGRHTLIKNGIELYSNINSTLYKEVIANELGYTPLIHKLLTGELRFTKMTPQARREILTTINPQNLDYLLNLYSLIKTTVKDNQVIIKHVTKKNADAKTKLMELNIPDNLEDDRKEKEERLNLLLPYSLQKLPNLVETFNKIDNCYKNLISMKQRLIKIDNSRINVSNVNNVEKLVNYINECSGRKTAIQINITNISNEIESMSSVNNSLLDNNLSIEEIDNRINTINLELSKLNYIELVTSNHEQYLKILPSLSKEFEPIFDNIKDIIFYSKDEQTEIFTIEQNLKNKLISVKTYLEKIEDRIEHYNNPESLITCPKCKTNFNNKGITAEDNINLLNENKNKALNELEIINKQTEENNLKIQDIFIYRNAIIDITNIKRNLYLPYDFWLNLDIEFVLKNNIIFHHYLIKWQLNLESNIKKISLETELNSYINASNIFKKYGTSLDHKLHKLEDDIKLEISNKNEIEDQLKYCNKLLNNINELNDIYEKSTVLKNTIDELFKIAIQISIKDNASEQMGELYNELAESKELMNRYSSLLNSINELDIEFKELNSKQEVYTILEEQLSPIKGLIAEIMLGFITNYVEQINSFIETIWEYSLEMGVCKLDNGNLDYYFPLYVEGNEVPDISNASEGQADILDLVFIIVMRQNLNIQDYPLYLDEIDSAFDFTHKKLLANYIRTIMNTDLCSQLFIINHNVDFYNQFVNKDVIVLDTRNIIIPDSYNQSVKITYQ